MRAGKHPLLLAFCLSLTFLAGCGEDGGRNEWVAVGPGSGQGDVSLFRDVQFSDIPVPAEYVLLPQESYSFQGARFRNGILVYQGELEWTQALNFYRTSMPQAGWRLERTERGFDFRVLYFSKLEEKLIVVVRQIRGGSRAELQLDNVDKNDLLLKGRLSKPGYQR